MKHIAGKGNVELSARDIAQAESNTAAWIANVNARAAEEVQRNRRHAYQSEADALYFEEQRGEVSEGTWTAKVAEIKLRFPK